MARPKKKNPKACYIRKLLKEIMDNTYDYPVTFIGAPAGFGKTTLLDNQPEDGTTLKMRLHMDTDLTFLYTISEFIQSEFPDFSEILRKLCEAENAEHSAESAVKSRDLEKRERHIKELEKEIFTVRNPVIGSDAQLRIIIDDMQFAESEELVNLLLKMALLSGGRLHFVISSRISYWNSESLDVIKGDVNLIESQDFMLTAEEIIKYFNDCGVKLEKNESLRLCRITGGWINILYLIVLEYLQSGKLTLTYNAHAFAAEQLSDYFNYEEKKDLYKLVLLDDFTLQQAQNYICGKSVFSSVRYNNEAGRLHLAECSVRTPKGVAEFISRLVKYNIFITYNREHRTYSFNSVFRKCMCEEFNTRKHDVLMACIGAAGDLYYEGGAFVKAAEYYYRAHMYENMMMSIEHGRHVGRDEEMIGNYVNYYRKCPRIIRSKYHLAVLYLAWRFFNYGELMLYREASLEFLEDLSADMSLSKKEKNSLLCDYSMFKAMTDYADLDKVKQDYENAMAVFDGNSERTHSVIPRTFGSTSVMKLFHREDSLEATLQKIEEISELGSKLIVGGWRGINYAAKAEAEFMRLNFDEADVMIKCAQRECKGSNPGVLLCMWYLGMQMAVLRGKPEELMDIVKADGGFQNVNVLSPLVRTAEVCKAWIFAKLGMYDRIEGWIKSGNFDEMNFFYPAMASIYNIYIYVLLKMEKYVKVMSFYDDMMSNGKIKSNVVASESSYMIFASACHEMGKTYNARRHLDEAVKLAQNTGNYISIAAYGEKLIPLMHDMIPQYGDFMRMLIRETKRCARNTKITAAYFKESEFKGLTRREYQVAVCAARGKINKEIAEELMISENTVKSTMKRVFSKMEISSRRELTQMVNKYNMD